MFELETHLIWGHQEYRPNWSDFRQIESWGGGCKHFNDLS